MSIKGQLAVLGGVFVIGGLGGAAVVHLTSDGQEAKRLDRAESSVELDELADASDELGVPTAEDGAELGIPLTHVLSTLESQYQASLANDQRAVSDNASASRDTTPLAPPRVEETSPPAEPAPLEPAPPPSDQPTIIGKRAPARAERVAALEVNDAEQVNVNPVTVNVTNVTENTTNNNTLVTSGGGYPLAYLPYAGYYAGYDSYVSAHPRVHPNGVYPGRVIAPPPVAPQPARVSVPGKRYDSLHPPAGADSPMFPAHASASLGPIFGGP